MLLYHGPRGSWWMQWCFLVARWISDANRVTDGRRRRRCELIERVPCLAVRVFLLSRHNNFLPLFFLFFFLLVNRSKVLKPPPTSPTQSVMWLVPPSTSQTTSPQPSAFHHPIIVQRRKIQPSMPPLRRAVRPFLVVLYFVACAHCECVHAFWFLSCC